MKGWLSQIPNYPPIKNAYDEIMTLPKMWNMHDVKVEDEKSRCYGRVLNEEALILEFRD